MSRYFAGLCISVLLSNAALAKGGTLCTSAETPIFTCYTGGKIVSLCAAGPKDFSHLRYAYGTPGKVELKITFEGGKLAEFVLIGDGDTNLDVVIKDAAGNVVVKDVDPPKSAGGGSDICVCRWTPKETAEFTIVILNDGELLNIAQAATN